MTKGRWRFHRPFHAGSLGLLVLEGFALERVALGKRSSVDLVGPGDVLRPWEEFGDSLSAQIQWRPERPVMMAELDPAFAAAIARFPEALLALTNRVFARRNSLALRLAIAQEAALADRLHLLLWHLADRWGRVGRDGTVVPLELSHQVLADLVSAQPRSVRRTLVELEETALVLRQPGDGWILRGEPPSVTSGQQDPLTSVPI